MTSSDDSDLQGVSGALGLAEGLAEHRITVLLIDDQAMVGEGVRRMLADQSDIDFHYQGDPTKAIETALEVKPTVILQDLVMPEVDGLTLVRFFRGNPQTREIPLIVLSTKEEPVVKAEAFSLGANDYLVKLPDRIELIARIRYHSKGYIAQLERNAAFRALRQEQEKAERLLLNILPEAIAERLKNGENNIADYFPEASVLFADIVGFTELSTRVTPEELVAELNEIFSAFDALTGKHEVEKIKTIGDAYMVVAGLPRPRDDHAAALVEMGLDMLDSLAEYNTRKGGNLGIRIGVNSGPVVAGIMGTKKFIYDLWGDTVNTASRMESHGVEGGVQVSQSTLDLLPEGSYGIEPRGSIKVKGKGEMQTYLVGRCA